MNTMLAAAIVSAGVSVNPLNWHGLLEDCVSHLNQKCGLSGSMAMCQYGEYGV